MTGPSPLALVAPPSFEGPLTEALSAMGLQALFHPRPEPEAGADPFHLEALARRLVGQVEGLLLVVPEHRAPDTVVPGPVACAIEAVLEPGSPARRAWRTYRILGNPRQPV